MIVKFVAVKLVVAFEYISKRSHHETTSPLSETSSEV